MRRSLCNPNRHAIYSAGGASLRERGCQRASLDAGRRHGRACGDTAGRAERSSMPTAGSLDLPSFRVTVDHWAGAGSSARQRGDQRHHARASRETGPARRAVSFGGDSAPRGIDRPRPPVPQRPAACRCERRWRRGGTRAGGSPRSRGAWAGGRGGRGRRRVVCERPAGSGFGALARWRSAEGKAARAGAAAPWPSLAVCAPPRPQERGL